MPVATEQKEKYTASETDGGVANKTAAAATYALGPQQGSVQVTDQRQTTAYTAPPGFLSSPWFIFLKDAFIVLMQLPYFPWLLLPLNLDRGWLFEDLTIGGFIYQVVALYLSVVVLFFASITFFLGFPATLIVSTFFLIQVLYIIQGNDTIITAENKESSREHQHEQWFHINGVCISTSSHKKALVRLQSIFKRDIVGINLRSLGFLGDVAECLVQRTFRWPTIAVREGYEVIKKAVLDGKNKRIVIIAYSQGSIVLSQIMDQLLAEFSHEQLKHIELYTLAGAANHFSAPLDSKGNSVWRHVEHFANNYDAIARFGVLHFANTEQTVHADDDSGSMTAPASHDAPAPPVRTSRFAGRVFRRDASGHLLLSHYLGKNSILDTKAARQYSQLVTYIGGANPATAH